MSPQRRTKQPREAFREERNVQFMLKNMAPIYEKTTEGALKQRAQLRKDLLKKKAAKKEQHQADSQTSPSPKNKRKGNPRKFTGRNTEMSVHVSKMSMDKIVDQFLPPPEREQDDTKPPANDVDSFWVRMHLIDSDNNPLEDISMKVQPTMKLRKLLTKFVIELEEHEVKEDEVELLPPNGYEISSDHEVGSLGWKDGSIVRIRKVVKTTAKFPYKLPEKKVDPFADSSDEEEDQEPSAKKRLRLKTFRSSD